jgi:lysozyme family protein
MAHSAEEPSPGHAGGGTKKGEWMDYFDPIADETIAIEKGYADVPGDRGGRTKYGITEETFRGAFEQNIISGVADVKDLTIPQAKAIYRALWWKPLRLQEIADPCIAGEIFDTAVNSGTGRASLLAQLALRYLGEKLDVDGVLGSVTIGLINKWCARDPRALMVALNGMQFVHFVAIADEGLLDEIMDRVKSDPVQFKFTRGWTKRIQEYRKEAA